LTDCGILSKKIAKINFRAYSAYPEVLQPELTEIRNAGTWKNERIIVSSQRTNIELNTGHKVLNFCANNYLGLSDNQELITAAKEALDKYGAGLSSVRFICGTQDIHRQLEAKIAEFHGREDAIAYASCFDANAGLFEILLKPEDAVISDELNHASIIDGIRLCKAQKFRYQHRNLVDLEAKLQETQSARLRLIVTDGVFSMDGKALGGAAGGYTTGSKKLIDLLRQRSRPYLFSNALPPPVAAIGIKALDLVMNNPSLMSRVEENTQRFRKAMKSAGFTINGDNHPIAPVMLGDAKLASTFADKMLERGIYVIGFSYPVVPKGKARIRVQLSAVHTPEDIDRTVNAFVEIGKELNVI
ncbi:Similar to GCAT: 2-amino-3-ketobutyrate coenzyme A ligase, partial [Cotesia congregata]